MKMMATKAALTSISTEGADFNAANKSPLSLAEVCGFVVLVLRSFSWAWFILKGSTSATNYFHTLFFVLWLLTSLTSLRFGQLLYTQVKFRIPVTIDVPWFLAKKTPLISAKYLSIGEQILLWIAGLFYPPAAGVVAIALWGKRHYMKARQANLIAFVCLIAWSVVALLSLL